MKRAFTLKQQRFIDFYRGNATAAAIEAGYSLKTAYSIGQENLKKPEILREIQARNEVQCMAKIANRQDRQEFWTKIMNDPEVDIPFRLKASELLGKSEADFSEKFEVKGEVKSIPTVSHADLEERIAQLKERVEATPKEAR